MFPALLIFSAGCSGINTSQSVSPLDFFMPGIGSFLYVPPASAPIPTTAAEALPPVVTLECQLAQSR